MIGRQSVLRSNSGNIIYTAAGPAPSHSRERLSAPTSGGPKLRAPGTSYPPTKFKMPPARSSVLGASKLPLKVLKTTVKMPVNFCWQPQDLTSTMNQGNCGSCWAHAMASVIGDRASVLTKGKIRSAMSVQQIMECSGYMEGVPAVGCEGNDPYTAIVSLVNASKKLCTYKDYPRIYSEKNSSNAKCESVDESKYHVTIKQAFSVSETITHPGDDANLRNIENMKHHIYFEGPIVGCFTVYSDFQKYDGTTIYEPEAGATEEGGHAIEIIGWGRDNTSGVEYWVCRNSWGTGWPAKHQKCTGTGTFYFRMGKNTCGMEAYCMGATPELHNTDKAPKNDAGGLFPGESACKANEWGTLDSPMFSKKLMIGIGAAVVVVGGAVAVAYFMRKKKRRLTA